jgi:predicted MFS family arabinose efflux permease
MSTAVGTSLIVIAMKSAAGFAGYLHSVTIDWPLVLAVTAAAIAGSVIGGRLTGRIPQDALRKTFGWFVIAMAVLVLTGQMPAGQRLVVILASAALGLAGAAVPLVLRARRGHREARALDEVQRVG